LTLPRRALRSIRERFRRLARARTEGGTHVYVLCLFIMMFLLVLFHAMFDYQRLAITKDTVDDALVTSMISACVYNKEELASSGSAVIYQSLTPSYGEHTMLSPGGHLVVDPTPTDVFSLPEIYAASSDTYLQNCWTLFLKNFKKNLKLGDDMVATISGIDGVVSVTEFSVYNKFYNLDVDRNQTDFMFVKYSYNPSSGAWSAYGYAPNTYPTCYNSLTHSNYQIVESSIATQLSFTVVAGTASTGMTNLTGVIQADFNVPVTYQRVVDVKLATAP